MPGERAMRMLVVDDEPENIQLMKRMFRKGYDVDVAQSGSEALSALERGSYDIIITDQMMPGMTGTELLTRSIELAPDAIRILVTGFPDLASAIASINEGRAYRFFTKPIDRTELVTEVERAVALARTNDVRQSEFSSMRRRIDELETQAAQFEANIEAEVSARADALLDQVTRLRARDPYDDETGLYNQQTLQSRLEEEIARSERYGLLCAFALVRITNLSTDIADEAIDRVSARLRLSMRRFDSAGRWTQDTFAVFMPHTDEKGAEACIRRLHAELSSFSFGTSGDAGNLEVAGSVAVYPVSGNSAEELIAEAEKALA